MVLGHIQPVIHTLCTFIHQTYTLYMSYTRYWDVFNQWYIACTVLNIRHTPCTCRIRGIEKYSIDDTYRIHFYTSDIHSAHVVYMVFGPYSTIDTKLIHFYASDIHTVHVIKAVLFHIQPLIHSLYTFIHQTYTLYMSFTRYWSIYQCWYMACTHLHIRHTPCTCHICGIGTYSTGDTWPVHFYASDIQSVHVVYTVLGHIQPLIHSLYTFIHQTFTLHMSYTRYWAIFKNWYIAYALLYIRHTPCTCRIRVIGMYSTGDT